MEPQINGEKKMTNNSDFRRILALVTAGRALMTDADRTSVVEQLKFGNRKQAVSLAVGVIGEKLCKEIKACEAKLRTAGHDPEFLAHVDLLRDAGNALTLIDVGAVIELLVTQKTGLVMLPDPADEMSVDEVPVYLGADLGVAKSFLAPIGIELFKRNGTHFQTVKRGFRRVTEEVLVVRLLPLGTIEPDSQMRAEEAAEIEVDYANGILSDVWRRCEAEPGDQISEELAYERRECALRVFDARVKLRLVQLGHCEMAWNYEIGRFRVDPHEDRSPEEFAESLVAAAAA